MPLGRRHEQQYAPAGLRSALHAQGKLMRSHLLSVCPPNLGWHRTQKYRRPVQQESEEDEDTALDQKEPRGRKLRNTQARNSAEEESCQPWPEKGEHTIAAALIGNNQHELGRGTSFALLYGVRAWT